ncbi:MAG: ferrous iron transport protein B [Dethiosulfovibrio peptidovorans]|nr:MAG: ferrous iron transport protein B [Dethiosulfovibrio peptidovorans]
MKRDLKVVALAGQPNCGKSTLFNVLTGARQHVANYPGVTVDIKKGRYRHNGETVELVDLPGTYSLTSFSSEEMVTRDFILSGDPRVVVNVLDASNLRRSLYLTFQLLEMGAPMVVALNMVDVAVSKELILDPQALSRELGVPVVETVGNRGTGSKDLKECLSVFNPPDGKNPFAVDYGPLEPILKELAQDLDVIQELAYPNRWLAIKIMEKDEAVLKIVQNLGSPGEAILQKAELLSQRFVQDHEEEPRAHIGLSRHLRAVDLESRCLEEPQKNKVLWSDRIDAVVVHKIFGPILLLFVIYGLYELSIVQGYKATEYMTPWLQRFAAWVAGILPPAEIMGGPLLRSLVISLVAAINSVLIYIPIFLILFGCVAIMEDVGYMPRIAFILDRILRRFGLHGQSTLPLILGGVLVGGCAVPGVVATRVIADEKARLATILVVPLMNCLAKIPLYTLLISVYFVKPSYQSAGMMVFISTVTLLMALAVSKVLTITVLKGKESAPFVMELPAYHIPTVRSVVTRAVERTWMFVRKVGTVVMAVAVGVYFLVNYPGLPQKTMDEYRFRSDKIVQTFRTKVAKTKYASLFQDDQGVVKLIDFMSQYKDARMAGLGGEKLEKRFEARDPLLFPLVSKANRKDKEAKVVQKAYKRLRRDRALLLKELSDETTSNSALGRVGRFLAPVTKYAGFDWKVNVALLSALAAKESTVATLGMIYKSADDDSQKKNLTEEMRENQGYTPLHALALMVFMALYPPCIATLVMVKVQANWSWAIFSLIYPIVLGFFAASVIFTGGQALGLSGFTASWVFYGLIILCVIALGLYEPKRKEL